MFGKSTIGLISVSILVFAALLAGQLAAQSISGTINGTVVDQSGAVIPGVEVTLINERTSETRNTVTGDTGEFVFAAVQPGSYTVKVEKTGFRGFNRKGIMLTVSERVALGRIQLELGEVSNTVDVTLQGETVTNESADTAGGLPLKQLDNIPINGREAMKLLPT